MEYLKTNYSNFHREDNNLIQKRQNLSKPSFIFCSLFMNHICSAYKQTERDRDSERGTQADNSNRYKVLCLFITVCGTSGANDSFMSTIKV